MSFTCDVNVLLYASDSASPVHAGARTFLDNAATGGDLWCITWLTAMSYLRIATHPRIFRAPLSPDEAFANVEALIRLPHVRMLSEEPGFLDVYREISGAFPVRGNIVPDAHLVALMRQHGVKTIYTRDTDFRKFSFVEVKDPLA